MISFNSCKSIDRIFVGSAIDELDEEELVELVIESQLEYDEIFFRRAFVEIVMNGSNKAGRANIYLKRDSAIIVSVMPIMGIELYRIKFDQDSVFLIDRMNRTTSESDYASFSKDVLVNFNFGHIQSILTNSIFVYPINNVQQLKRFYGVKNENYYSLTSAGVPRFKKDESFQVVDILPDIFRINNSYISYPSRDVSMDISYQDFVSIDGNKPFPLRIVFKGESSLESVLLTLTFSSVVIDGDQSISFSVPSNYAKIKF